MGPTLRLSVAALALFSAIPTSAATFVNVGDNATISFDGTEAGTSASLYLELLDFDASLSTFTFSYALTNTSNLALNPSVRVSGFGFDDIGTDTTTGTASTSDTNGFDTIDFNVNYPDGLGFIEFCLYESPGSCTGNGNGATVGDPSEGIFTLDYNVALTQLTLDDFVARYQATGINGQGSGTGVGTEIPDPSGAVPEPSTWAMMLMGFGAVAAGMRRRKRLAVGEREAFIA